MEDGPFFDAATRWSVGGWLVAMVPVIPWKCLYRDPALPAWIQAIGSIAAIIGAAWIATRTERRAERARRKEVIGAAVELAGIQAALVASDLLALLKAAKARDMVKAKSCQRLIRVSVGDYSIKDIASLPARNVAAAYAIRKYALEAIDAVENIDPLATDPYVGLISTLERLVKMASDRGQMIEKIEG